VAHHEDLLPTRNQRLHHLLRLNGYVIKKFFANYFLHMSDDTFDMSKNSMEVHQRKA